MKRLVFMLLGLLVYSSGYAKRISEQDAYNAARQFMSGKSIKAKPQLVKGAKGEPKLRNYYLFNIENNGGFVIVSGDDRTRSILGYADKGEIIANELPCNVKWLLDYYDKEISTLPDSEEPFPSEFPAKVAENRYDIPMLIETQWGQGEPYNLNCPSHQGLRCVTGCVATAMAQVINYHRWPQEKTSEVAGYTTATHKINMPGLPQKKFDWNNMGSSAIAQLMLYCGQSVQMDYDTEGSAAYAAMVPDALSNVFGFSKGVTYVARRDYSDDEWDHLVFNDLSQGLPVLYFGQSPDGGHAFIVDGYSAGMYHINWGWEGSCDGNFYLDRLNPFSDTGFNSSQEMIINACPPAGSSEINRPKAVIKELSCNERNLERPNVNSAFPAFNLNASIESDVTTNISLKLGLALYDDNGMVKMLSQTSHNFTPNENVYIESQITLTSDIKQGEYRIVSVSRGSDSEEWIPNIESTAVYVRVNIEVQNAQLQPLPLSEQEKYIIEYGTHTIDGITYRLYSEFGNLRANILAPDYAEKYSGDIYIPDNVTYQNMRFDIYGLGNGWPYPDPFIDNDEITSISLPNFGIVLSNISYCHNLKSIDFREGTVSSLYIDGCTSLENISFPSSCGWIAPIVNCPKLSKLYFKRTGSMTVCPDSEGQLWSKESLPSLTDVYFSGELPPTFNLYYPDSSVVPNKDIKIHIPKGTLEAYNCTEWKEWSLIEDQSAVQVSVSWDYCGNYQYIGQGGGGVLAGCGKNDMEFAMRIPAELIAPYKNCKITAIEYHTGPIGTNEGPFYNVEYVFLTSPGIDYITKQSSRTIRQAWTRVELSDPYIVTGEDLFVGVGRYSSLSIKWTNDDEVVDDGMWARNMGPDKNGMLFARPGTWVKHLGIPDWNHPLPIRAIIEGENLPEDMIILNAEFTSQEKPQNSASDSKSKLSQLSKDSLQSDDKYFVEEINFARNETSTNKIDLDDREKPQRISADNDKLKIKVRNRCSHVVKNITFDWSIDGEVQQPVSIETGLLKNFDDYLIIDLPNDLSGRYHTVKVDVSKIDGKPDEIKANSVIEESIAKASSTYFPRKTVMEEATGTWCGYCPMGSATVEKMKELYPNNFIAIAVHDDEMTPPDNSYSEFLKSVYSFPNSLINRTSWRDLWPFDLEETTDNGEALIKATASFGDGRNVNVSTETVFGFSDKGNDNYRIAYVVLEDNVGPYLQTNYYSNPNSEDNPDDLLNWWVHQNQYVLTTFNDVARGIYDYDGIKGLFPENIVEGDSYKSEYSLSLPYNIQDAANLKIVTLLIDTRTGEIMNADCTKISGEVPNFIVLGDTNGNGEVNIADAVNIANYVVGKDVENFVIQAADVNEDGKITFSDASATVSLILNQLSASPEGKMIRSAIRYNDGDNDALVVDNYSSKSAGSQTLSIALDNSKEYVALQADIKLPDGMSLSDIRIGDIAENTHSLMTRNIDEHNIRVVLFNLENIPFSSDGNNIIELAVHVNSECTGDIELSNIIASDAHAHEYDLASIGGHNGGISGSAVLADASDSIALGKGVINISNASGKHIAVSTADGKIVSSFDAHSDFESVSVASGIYLVRVGNRTHKVIIK